MSGHLIAYERFQSRPANQGALAADELDGLLTSILILPDPPDPVEYMFMIWGQATPEFENDTEQAAVLDGIAARRGEIAGQLGDHGPPRPYLLDGRKDGGATGWAKGFSRGMNLRPWAWDTLINSDENMQLLAPIVAHLDDGTGLPLPTSTGRSIDEVRAEAAQIIPAALSAISLFFEIEKQKTSSTGGRGSAPKTGRNEPCPCGSGKKYKKCCLVN